MTKSILSTAAAPAAIGPYSQGVRANGFCFFSGMLAIDPATGSLTGETADAQTEHICKNIAALLDEAGLTARNIVKTTVFLTDLAAFGKVNEAYGRFFACEPPARSCVQVARLPRDALVEIECIAAE